MNAAFVLDCSVLLRWLLKEVDEESSVQILERVAMHGAVVPSVWPLEVANVLVTKTRARVLKADVVKRLLADIHPENPSRVCISRSVRMQSCPIPPLFPR